MNDAVFGLIGKGMYLLGDDALKGLKPFIAPFTPGQLAVLKASNMQALIDARAFNFVHSSKRMSSEHVIGSLKRWAIIRGTSKFFMFRDSDKFKTAVLAVHALHNAAKTGSFKNDACGWTDDTYTCATTTSTTSNKAWWPTAQFEPATGVYSVTASKDELGVCAWQRTSGVQRTTTRSCGMVFILGT